MGRDRRYSLTFAEQDSRDRFHSAKRRAQSRMDRSDLSTDEFMALLLDVYQLHLHEGADAEAREVRV